MTSRALNDDEVLNEMNKMVSIVLFNCLYLSIALNYSLIRLPLSSKKRLRKLVR